MKQVGNLFEEALCNVFGGEGLLKIQQVVIGIAGAGGLGSNCSVNLVRSGFTKFVIVDFDQVEYSNLNRQFYFYDQVGRPKVEALKENLLRINPNVELEIHQQRIEGDNIEELFQKCHMIVEAFDQASYKKLLVEHYINQNKLIVSASGIGGWDNSDQLKTHKVKDDLYIVGDLTSQVSKEVPPCAPRVAIAAAKQADIILAQTLKGG